VGAFVTPGSAGALGENVAGKGLIVGEAVGELVAGEMLGVLVWSIVGVIAVGFSVAREVGSIFVEGEAVRFVVGVLVAGEMLGVLVWSMVGVIAVGFSVAREVGSIVVEGEAVGLAVGVLVARATLLPVGVLVWSMVGVIVIAVGYAVAKVVGSILVGARVLGKEVGTSVVPASDCEIKVGAPVRGKVVGVGEGFRELGKFAVGVDEGVGAFELLVPELVVGTVCITTKYMRSHINQVSSSTELPCHYLYKCSSR
jgi:hypothetical protein